MKAAMVWNRLGSVSVMILVTAHLLFRGDVSPYQSGAPPLTAGCCLCGLNDLRPTGVFTTAYRPPPGGRWTGGSRSPPHHRTVTPREPSPPYKIDHNFELVSPIGEPSPKRSKKAGTLSRLQGSSPYDIVFDEHRVPSEGLTPGALYARQLAEFMSYVKMDIDKGAFVEGFKQAKLVWDEYKKFTDLSTLSNGDETNKPFPDVEAARLQLTESMKQWNAHPDTQRIIFSNLQNPVLPIVPDEDNDREEYRDELHSQMARELPEKPFHKGEFEMTPKLFRRQKGNMECVKRHYNKLITILNYMKKNDLKTFAQLSLSCELSDDNGVKYYDTQLAKTRDMLNQSLPTLRTACGEPKVIRQEDGVELIALKHRNEKAEKQWLLSLKEKTKEAVQTDISVKDYSEAYLAHKDIENICRYAHAHGYDAAGLKEHSPGRYTRLNENISFVNQQTYAQKCQLHIQAKTPPTDTPPVVAGGVCP
eukprot:GHVQ01011706.1.p1 GENE.GHVQ01011706.1~~GHVQ01011706.1.p1  ORF type:complete len:476 (+),score=43.34 GHVQ01011706.1:290-1717(+)